MLASALEGIPERTLEWILSNGFSDSNSRIVTHTVSRQSAAKGETPRRASVRLVVPSAQ